LVSEGKKPIYSITTLFHYGIHAYLCNKCENGVGSVEIECLMAWMPLDWAEPEVQTPQAAVETEVVIRQNCCVDIMKWVPC
jgi:hypothetical protein